MFKAGCKFEHMRWPSFGTDRLALESHGEQEIELLLGHYKTLYSYLGGDPAKARCEWRRLKLYVGREATLISLSYFELYERLFNQKGNTFLYGADGTCSDKLDELSFYNILLLVAIIMSYAVDTSICERGFALMNNLKTARRSRMGGLLLRTLMIICELGKEWADPTKIPVEEIVAEWREQSARGRYEGAMWRAAGLEEPTPAAAAGTAGCVPSQYQVKEIKEIWGVRYAPNAAEPPSRPYSPCPLRLRQARQSHQDGAAGAGRDHRQGALRVHCVRRLCEPLAVRVRHDGLYWVPLSKLINDVTRAKAVVEIEIFEGNLAQLREIEMAELSSEDEEESD